MSELHRGGHGRDEHDGLSELHHKEHGQDKREGMSDPRPKMRAQSGGRHGEHTDGGQGARGHDDQAQERVKNEQQRNSTISLVRQALLLNRNSVTVSELYLALWLVTR